jgi:recombinational DNA repair protein (RecF pathway)
MSATKHCNLCGTTKPLTEFYTKPNGKPRAGCKACLCAASRKRDPEYQKTHRESCRAKALRWRKRNLERARKLSCAAVKRYRRRKRDRSQTFLPLETE